MILHNNVQIFQHVSNVTKKKTELVSYPARAEGLGKYGN